MMLRERGVPVSSVKFAKTEASKPYINTVRSMLFFSSRSKEVVAAVQLPEPDHFPSVELIRILSPFPHPHKTYNPHGRKHSTTVPRIAHVFVTPSFRYQLSHPGHDIRQTQRTIPLRSSQPITDSPEHDQLHIGYNVTHDAGLIAMAFEVGTTPDQPWIDPPAHRIGVDVMRLSIPDRFTFQTFVETVGDAVRCQSRFPRFPPWFFRFSPPSLRFFRCSVIQFRPRPLPVFTFPRNAEDVTIGL